MNKRGWFDHDCDGIPDNLDPDDDNDGYFDSKQDSDRDGILNEFDDDDDNDGIPDSEDPDANGDGIPDCIVKDSDGDHIPDHIDTDDDNDGIPDLQDPDHPNFDYLRDSDKNAALALPILAFTSASEPPCSSMLLPRYVKDSTPSRVSPSIVIGLFSALNLRILVFPLCMLRPTDAETAATLAVFVCICSCVCDRRDRSSAKSKSSNWF
ncbi:unnamed protein product [Schistosoma curassoni]|uniref:Thrombospondin n=1 Tax=Schistosoma curassoni TaxID=6186 RepID=A0A183KAI8_9TREM|nr:unnamed protein product [Schistosoma curassoni]